MNLDEANAVLTEILSENPDYAKLMLSDESDNPYGIPMTDVASIVLSYQSSKDAGYGRSWAKRGHAGVFHNVMRKADRYDKLAERMKLLETVSLVFMSETAQTRTVETAFIDLLIDVSAYCMMWLSYLAKTDNAFMRWLESTYCPETGEDYGRVVRRLSHFCGDAD